MCVPDNVRIVTFMCGSCVLNIHIHIQCNTNVHVDDVRVGMHGTRARDMVTHCQHCARA